METLARIETKLNQLMQRKDIQDDLEGYCDDPLTNAKTLFITMFDSLDDKRIQLPQSVNALIPAITTRRRTAERYVKWLIQTKFFKIHNNGNTQYLTIQNVPTEDNKLPKE